jgi:hypothetical protein
VTGCLAVAWVLLFTSGCVRVEVTPGSVRAAQAPWEEREAANARWVEAVGMANEFLESSYRKTLPPGRIELGDDGMRFVTADGWWPLGVRCTTWGGVVNAIGGQAQATTSGFLTGRRGPADRDPDPALDNSFFRAKNGAMLEAEDLARMFLHELAHILYRKGTIGFLPSVAYFLEAVFLLRSSTHSAEDRPRATSEEFTYFRFATTMSEPERSIAARQFEEHFATGSPICEHGPFEESPRPPRR